jgi:hypothetical protein
LFSLTHQPRSMARTAVCGYVFTFVQTGADRAIASRKRTYVVSPVLAPKADTEGAPATLGRVSWRLTLSGTEAKPNRMGHDNC